MKKTVVLAFSGGLDTSFCVPYLLAQDFEVHTIFVNTGGVSSENEQSIEQRAYELGATKHHTIDAKQSLWDDIVVPLVWANKPYQEQYPTLCADRYLIVEEAIKLCKQLNTKYIAHGCTGMGNDQVRFDLAITAHGDYQILSPIREIQKQHKQTRQFEIDYLQAKGFSVSTDQSRYSINENLLGVTISGAEIDDWQEPQDDTYVLCKPPAQVEKEPINITLNFEQGVVTSLDQKPIYHADILQYLNQLAGQYGIGRDIYTGDTIIGLKGRILFEAPGLKLLQTAQKALEEVCLTNKQNQFKPILASQWTELVYNGFYFDPLYQNILCGLKSIQNKVSGKVTLKLYPHKALAVDVQTRHALTSSDASYAQSASWGIEEAVGFIKLYGKSTATWSLVNADSANADNDEAALT